MKRYFKHEAESQIGMGWWWCEFEDDWATRQVEAYGERWFWADDEHWNQLYPPDMDMGLCNQPLSALFEDWDLIEAYAISAAEFEEVWEIARRQDPRPDTHDR